MGAVSSSLVRYEDRSFAKTGSGQKQIEGKPPGNQQGSGFCRTNLSYAGKGVGINKKTLGWNAAGAVFAYGFGTLATLGYKYVGQDQLIGGTWPDNEPAVSCMDWQVR